MQAVRYHEHGGPEVLQVEAVERPDPGEGEVLVETRAAAVNPVDTYFREGSYPTDLPRIPGSDVAGVVAETGPGVDSFDVGDGVFATGLGNDRDGTCAEFAAVPTDLAAHLPEGVDFQVGAAVALVGVTAWRSLVARCGLEPGETALVHGGSGGVGHVAVQLAATAGADVTATASPPHHDVIADLGADTVLDYAHEDLADAIVDAGRPDVVLDHRLDDYLGLDCQVAAFGARIAAIGNEHVEATFPDVPAARAKALTVHHASMFNTPDVGQVLSRLAALVADGDLTAAVEQIYDLEEVAKAQRDVLERSFAGKLVVVP